MRPVSDLIAPSGPEREHRPVGPIACAVFVVALATSVAGAAYFMGAAVAGQPGPTVDESYAAE